MKKIVIVLVFLFLIFAGVYLFFPSFFSRTHTITVSSEKISNVLAGNAVILEEEIPEVSHVETPENVKAIYMTSWVAGTPSFRRKLVDIAETTEINSIVIDIKDYTGKIAYVSRDPLIQSLGSSENRISDVDEFLESLHEKNIYVIGRIAVFQDPHMVALRPDLAVKRKSDGGIWRDRKGIPWIDPGAKEMWDYTVAIAREAHERGFDELNFDYIRFPSDGNMSDIYYPKSEAGVKSEVLREFFSYLNEKLKTDEGSKRDFFWKKHTIITSADLFGMTTTARDDMNIGQILENAFPYFDYIAPMVYPSHYPAHFNGYGNPASLPYEVISFAMGSAVQRANMATTSPLKLRPWLQDFDLGADYTKEMVRTQIQATYDVGLTSWMLWDPSNIYTREALFPEPIGAEF